MAKIYLAPNTQYLGDARRRQLWLYAIAVIIVLALTIVASVAVLWLLPGKLFFTSAPPVVITPEAITTGFDLRPLQTETYQNLNRELGALPVTSPEQTGKVKPLQP